LTSFGYDEAPALFRRTFAAFAALSLAGCSPAPGGEHRPAAGPRVYVTNEMSGDLSIIDPAANKVVSRIALGKRPRGIIPSPDGRLLYIALSGSPIAGPGVDESKLPPADKTADGIAVLDVASGKVVRVLRGISDPEQIAVSPDGRTLYVASEDTGQVMLIDAAQGGVRAKLVVGGEPEGLAASPDGDLVYATSEEDSTIAVIDTKHRAVKTRIPVGKRPRTVAFLPSGTRALVPGENDATVSVIDVASSRVVRTMHIDADNAKPMGVVITPQGDSAFVTTGRGGELVRINIANLTVSGAAVVGERPWGVALSPDSRFVFTANGPSNDVAMVDARTMGIVARFKVGERPWGVATVPAP